STAGMADHDAGSDAATIGPSCAAACTGDDMCSLNRCTSRACATAETDREAVVGCLFYTARVGNVASDADRAESFLGPNPATDTAWVVLQVAQRDQDGRTSWLTLSGATVARTSSSRFSVSGLSVNGAGLFPAAAIRLSSTRPVTVSSVESDDRNQGQVSSSGG